jgi:hypothetical protein
MSGKAGYKPTPGYEDKMHMIGDSKSPVWIGRKGDVPGLMTREFWIAYSAWRMFNLGFGFPDPGTWTEQDQWLVEAMAAFEEHYRARFSPERSQQAQMEAILARRGR